MRKLLATLLLTAGLVSTALAEDEEPEITVESGVIEIRAPGGRDLPIAVPKPKGSSAAVDEIWGVVRADLDRSGYFEVIDPDAYVEPTSAGIRLGEFNFLDWELPDPVVLAKTGLGESSDTVTAELWVYDVPARRKLGARRFTAGTGSARYVGHRISDEIIRLVTGELGINTTKFAASHNATGNKEVTLVDVDGHNVTPITRNGSINLQPAWNAGGDRIAYTSYRSGNPDLYVADLKNGKVNRISSRSGVNMGAAWNPLGGSLVLTRSSGGTGGTDLFSIDPDTGRQLFRLTQAPGIDVSASFSPDGQWIAFASERSGGVQIYVMSATGGDARRVTFQGSHNTDPAWSPRGDSIAFVGRDGHFDVFTVHPEGKSMTRVTQDQGGNEDPCWSPDGRYLAFSSSRGGASDIWMATADGRHQVQVTRGGGWTNPAWSPRLSW